MRYRWLYNLATLTLVTYFLVTAGLKLWEARLWEVSVPEPEVDVAAQAPSQPTPTVSSLERYAVIAERNLFGTSSKQEEKAALEAVLADIPLAKKGLGLKLVGTVVSTEPQENLAIIENQRAREQEAYHEGERVGQALVKRILRNNVIINTGSGNEVLAMEPEENDRGAQVSRHPYGRPPGAPAPELGGSSTLEREEVEASLADLNQVMQQVRIRPFMEGDQPGGFQVSRIDPGSIFAKMGLKDGDVIKSVNGELISNPEDAIEFYNTLMEGGTVALEIKRGGRTRELQIEID